MLGHVKDAQLLPRARRCLSSIYDKHHFAASEAGLVEAVRQVLAVKSEPKKDIASSRVLAGRAEAARRALLDAANSAAAAEEDFLLPWQLSQSLPRASNSI